jgi:hypothetical protein
MMRTCKIGELFIFFLLFFRVGGAGGGELSFIASVDKTRLSIDEQLTLTVTVSGKDVGSVSEPEPPALTGFQVEGTSSSTSTQFQFINGRMSSSKTINFIYYLQPIQIGEIKIGSFRLNMKDEIYHTDPITVRVMKSGGGPTQPPRATKPQIPSEEISGRKGDVFLLASYSPQKVWLGEQVTATYFLCTRSDLTNVQYGKLPAYTGFWAEDLYQVKALDFHPQVIDGKRYDVAKLREVALFPTTEGQLKVDPLELVCDVRVRTRDFFDSFWGRSKRLRIRSNPGDIEVIPLPEGGTPEGFAGAVGDFTIQSELDKRQVKAGNPVNLSVTIQGRGNLKLIAGLMLPPLEGFKRYEPEVEEKISKANSRMGGRKVFRYVLIPQKEGDYRIDPITLPYFDPQARCYRLASSQSIILEVTPGEKEEMVASYPLSREIKLLGKDIRYLKPNLARLPDQGKDLYQSPLYLLFHILPILAIFASFAYRRHYLRVSQDIGYARQRSAKGLTQKRLRQAKRLLKEGSGEEFYGAISKALTDYIGDKLNISATGLTTDQLLDKLGKRGYPQEVREGYLACFHNCDYARFSPSSMTREGMEEILRLAQKAIFTMEKTAKQGGKIG